MKVNIAHFARNVVKCDSMGWISHIVIYATYQSSDDTADATRTSTHVVSKPLAAYW